MVTELSGGPIGTLKSTWNFKQMRAQCQFDLQSQV